MRMIYMLHWIYFLRSQVDFERFVVGSGYASVFGFLPEVGVVSGCYSL